MFQILFAIIFIACNADKQPDKRSASGWNGFIPGLVQVSAVPTGSAGNLT